MGIFLREACKAGLSQKNTHQSQVDAVLVVEAKRDDLTRGFTQLTAAMTELGDCYGVVTTGNIWQFAQLQGQQITQDLNLYPMPADLAELISILTGILTT